MNVPVRSKAATVRLVRCFITFLPSGVHSFVATRQANSVPNVVSGCESDLRGSWRGTYRLRRVSGELRRRPVFGYLRDLMPKGDDLDAVEVIGAGTSLDCPPLVAHR